MQYKDWIKFSFDRPITDPAWYWDPKYDNADDLEDKLAIEFLTTLFSSPLISLKELSDAQVNQGLWYLISSSSSPCISALFSEKVPWESRKFCINSIKNLFSEFFTAKCIEVLSHSDLDGSVSKKSPLNSICYMFWDLIPWNSEASDRNVYLAYLDVIEEILRLNHLACRESALHGLGHSQCDYPKRVQTIIDGFISDNPNIDIGLKEYALEAKVGNIQ